MCGCGYTWWTACVYAKSLDGDSQVPYLNWNSDKRKLNANDVRNDWDGRVRFLFVRNLISFCNSTKAKLSCYYFLCFCSSNCFST